MLALPVSSSICVGPVHLLYIYIYIYIYRLALYIVRLYCFKFVNWFVNFSAQAFLFIQTFNSESECKSTAKNEEMA